MATRWPFGGALEAWVFDLDDDHAAVVAGGQTVTFWDARVGGNQITDLSTDLAGTMPVVSVAIDDGTGTYGRGFMPEVYGPVGVKSMWASANNGPRRKINTNAPDVVAADAASTAVTSTAAKIEASAFNVKDRPAGQPFAYGDAAHDDTAAINAIIAAAPAGSIIRFPAGVYLVSSTGDPNGFMIKIAKQNITLEGAGTRSTIIKVKNSNGDYTAVVSDGTTAGATNMSGLTIRNLTVDQNSANNVITNAQADPGLFHGRPRLAVRVYNGTDVTIRDCQFVNSDCVNTVVGNGGDTIIKRWVIENCLFAGVGANSPIHDHSSIYYHGETIRVEGCTFLGAGVSAIAAIEVHGSNQTVINNVVDAYASIGNVTGVANITKNVLFSGNVGTRMGVGIQLWAYNNVGGVTPALDNVIVSNNRIEIDYDRWKTALASSYRFGIALSPTSSGVVRIVRIEGNQITYLPHSQTPSGSDNLSAGILWTRSASPTVGFADEDIEIINNVIRGSIGAGIHVQPKFKTRRLKIAHNRIIDPGQGAPNTAYRVGIFLACEAFPLEDGEVSSNDLIDTNTQAHVVIACIDTQFTDNTKNCRAYDNTVRCQDNGSVPVHRGDFGAAAAWFIRTAMPVFTAPPGVWAAGSTITETDTGQQFTQTLAPAGATWTVRSVGVSTNSNVFRSGRWYRSEGVGVNVIPTKSLMYLTPFTVGAARLFDRIGITVITGQTGTSARLGIYGSDVNGVPYGLPKLATQVATDTAGDKEVAIATILSPGLYWLACVTQSGGTQPTLRGLSAAGGQSTGVAAGATISEATANTPRTAYTQANVTGALGVAADNGSSSLSPLVVLRVIGTTAQPPPGGDEPPPPPPPPPNATPGTYRTSGRYLFDPLGAKIIVRGVEQVFFRADGGWLSNEFATEISKTKSNTMRMLPYYTDNTPAAGDKATLADLEDQIRRGIDGHMLVDFAADGGRHVSTFLRPEVLSLIRKYERWMVLHAKGESYEDTDTEWATECKSVITQLRNAGLKLPLYMYARNGGRNLPCILNKGAEILAADPMHNIVFGWQAYWGDEGGWQDNFGMSLDQAFAYCRDAPVCIQVGLLLHSDPQDNSPQTIPYQHLMQLAFNYDLGWLWWDYRMGIDNLTTDGYLPHYTSLGTDVLVDNQYGIGHTSTRTPFQLAQVSPPL